MDELKLFASEIANVLGVGVPSVELDLSGNCKFAEYDPVNDKMTIIRQVGSNEFFLEIAHEMRHKWQWIKEHDKYFSNYKELDESRLKEYGEQTAEVDANAFAMVMMVRFFRNICTFEVYSESERKAIFKRGEQISEDYGVSIPWDSLYAGLGIDMD